VVAVGLSAKPQVLVVVPLVEMDLRLELVLRRLQQIGVAVAVAAGVLPDPEVQVAEGL
jgi:hypothetical protein